MCAFLAGVFSLPVRNRMPRLGDDPNMATAYPDRVNTNLRGSWMRQMLYTMVGTLVLYKVVCTDYKVRLSVALQQGGWCNAYSL